MLKERLLFIVQTEMVMMSLTLLKSLKEQPLLEDLLAMFIKMKT